MADEIRPEFVSRKRLAALLDLSERTIDEYVRRGVLPMPIRLSDGLLRWHWATVERALISLQGAPLEEEDPAVAGVRHVAERRARERAERAEAQAAQKAKGRKGRDA
jgi:predicted DNA-binding transcriptional regulator AlpA